MMIVEGISLDYLRKKDRYQTTKNIVQVVLKCVIVYLGHVQTQVELAEEISLLRQENAILKEELA